MGRSQEATGATAGAAQQSEQGMQADWPELPAQQTSGTRRARRPPPQQPGDAAQPATPPPSPVKVAPQRLVGTRCTDDDDARERGARMRADFENFSWQLRGEAADSEGAAGAGAATHEGSALASVGQGRDGAREPAAAPHRGKPAHSGSPYRGPSKRQPDSPVPSPPRPKASRQGGSPYRGQPKRQPASAVRPPPPGKTARQGSWVGLTGSNEGNDWVGARPTPQAHPAAKTKPQQRRRTQAALDQGMAQDLMAVPVARQPPQHAPPTGDTHVGGTTEMESDEAAEAGVQPTGLTAALQPPPQLSSEVALARLLHPELRYTWQVTKKGNTVVAVGVNALTDDLSGAVKYRIHERERAVGKGQLQGAIRALIAARGGTPPGSVTGSVEQLRGHLAEARSRLRAMQGVQHEVNGEEALIRAAYSRVAAEAAPAAAGARPGHGRHRRRCHRRHRRPRDRCHSRRARRRRRHRRRHHHRRSRGHTRRCSRLRHHRRRR